MKVLALVPYPLGLGPSQRFRLEVFQEHALAQGIEIDIRPFYDEAAYGILYAKGRFLDKALYLVRGYLRRYALLSKSRKYDLVYIQREAGPVGFPMIAWIVKKILKKPLVFDFDDAIWLPNYSESNALFHWLKAYGKTRRMISWSDVVSAGNEYLADYARRFNAHVEVLPTVVDTDHHKPATSKSNGLHGRPVIGWTGTHSTMRYLDPLVPILRSLENKYEFEFLVISNSPPTFSLNSLRYRSWSKKDEIEDLSRMDLGVMPIFEDEKLEFSKGKCGFKLIQYQALAIPTLASDIGVNGLILIDGVTGHLCRSAEEWEHQLDRFLASPTECKDLGNAGRAHIKTNYSVEAQAERFTQILQQACSGV